eukprot:602337-Pleurochrysis_carterae.AAC.1
MREECGAGRREARGGAMKQRCIEWAMQHYRPSDGEAVLLPRHLPHPLPRPLDCLEFDIRSLITLSATPDPALYHKSNE